MKAYSESTSLKEQVLSYNSVKGFIPLETLKKYGLDPDSHITHLYISPKGLAMFIAQRMRGQDALFFKLDLVNREVKAIQLSPLKRISLATYKPDGSFAVFYSLYGSKLYYLQGNRLTEVKPKGFSILISPDAPFSLVSPSNYLLTLAGFRDKRGFTDGKIYITLVDTLRSTFYKITPVSTLEERVSEITGDKIRVVGLLGYGNYIYAILRGTKGDYIARFNYSSQPLKFEVIHREENSKIVQYGHFSENLSFISHPKGKPFSYVKILNMATGKVKELDKGKVLTPAVSDSLVGYISFKGDKGAELIVRDIKSGDVLKIFKLDIPNVEALYLNISNDLRVFINDNRGFMIF